MSKKTNNRSDALASIQWWSGFDRDDLNGKARARSARKDEAVCWPFYTA